jgi:hypothetical protein
MVDAQRHALPLLGEHDGQDGVVPLFHDAELHQHGPLLPAKGPGQADEPLDEWQALAGATVKDQAKPVSKMSRNSVNPEVVPECPG